MAECTAKMAMSDRLGATGANQGEVIGVPVAKEEAERFSLARTYRRGGGGSGDGGCGDGGGGGGGGGSGGNALPATAAETVVELQRLQKHLVTQLQNEYFCDDVEPPAEAFGWTEEKLKDFFESGGA